MRIFKPMFSNDPSILASSYNEENRYNQVQIIFENILINNPKQNLVSKVQ